MILVYWNQEDKNLLEVLEASQFVYRCIGDQQKDSTMRQLLEHPESSETSGPTFLFLADMDQREQLRLADTLKENQLFIPRVAIKTEHNIDWTLRDLLEEIEREYHYFLAREDLYYLITHPDKERLASDKRYLRMMSYGMSVLEKEESTTEELQECIRQIRELQTESMARRLKQ